MLKCMIHESKIALSALFNKSTIKGFLVFIPIGLLITLPLLMINLYSIIFVLHMLNITTKGNDLLAISIMLVNGGLLIIEGTIIMACASCSQYIMSITNKLIMWVEKE